MSRRGRKNYIRRPDVVERIGSYLGTSFPLFHGYTPPRDAADICLALCLANDVPNSNLDTSYPDI